MKFLSRGKRQAKRGGSSIPLLEHSIAETLRHEWITLTVLARANSLPPEIVEDDLAEWEDELDG
jgi:hypothetical protein